MLFLVGVWRHFAVVSVYSVCLFDVFFFPYTCCWGRVGVVVGREVGSLLCVCVVSREAKDVRSALKCGWCV